MRHSESGGTSKGREEQPKSRFWSCFFANSIFALLWTLDMKKTLKWLAVGATTYGTAFLVLFLGMAVGEFLPEIGYELSTAVTLTFIIIIFVADWPVSMFFMYRWVTAYNLEHFGYASKSELDKARREGNL